MADSSNAARHLNPHAGATRDLRYTRPEDAKRGAATAPRHLIQFVPGLPAAVHVGARCDVPLRPIARLRARRRVPAPSWYLRVLIHHRPPPALAAYILVTVGSSLEEEDDFLLGFGTVIVSSLSIRSTSTTSPALNLPASISSDRRSSSFS